jgi:DNA invertase Pin-like site-specific DNA recombinase
MAPRHKSQRWRSLDHAPLDDLYDYARAPARPGRRRATRASVTWAVSDDWPKDVPVTETEIDVFEAWFGDLFDELFGKDRGDIAMAATVRAALYLRVSTGRQADSDLSIPDQRRQAKGYCASRGWEIITDYVEPGAAETDDRRLEFQRMIDVATAKPPAFDVILVHSFSRFFRDQFQLEFYVRRLAKNGVRLVSITQELGDDPMSNMIRQIMALFDEYQSKENAKHTLRAMKENARQGFWNGALPPIGYRIVEAAEQRGHRTKKALEKFEAAQALPSREALQ